MRHRNVLWASFQVQPMLGAYEKAWGVTRRSPRVSSCSSQRASHNGKNTRDVTFFDEFTLDDQASWCPKSNIKMFFEVMSKRFGVGHPSSDTDIAEILRLWLPDPWFGGFLCCFVDFLVYQMLTSPRSWKNNVPWGGHSKQGESVCCDQLVLSCTTPSAPQGPCGPVSSKATQICELHRQF